MHSARSGARHRSRGGGGCRRTACPPARTGTAETWSILTAIDRGRCGSPPHDEFKIATIAFQESRIALQESAIAFQQDSLSLRATGLRTAGARVAAAFAIGIGGIAIVWHGLRAMTRAGGRRGRERDQRRAESMQRLDQQRIALETLIARTAAVRSQPPSPGFSPP